MKLSSLIVGAILALAFAGTPASAQNFENGPDFATPFQNGPYYPTPSWDQKIPGAQRFIVLLNWNKEAVLDRETGLVWQRTPASNIGPSWVGVLQKLPYRHFNGRSPRLAPAELGGIGKFGRSYSERPRASCWSPI